MTITYLDLSLLVLALVALSLSGALFLKLRAAKKTRPESIELKEFINDLMNSNSAMVRVQRVDQSNLFLRSPRDL